MSDKIQRTHLNFEVVLGRIVCDSSLYSEDCGATIRKNGSVKHGRQNPRVPKRLQCYPVGFGNGPGALLGASGGLLEASWGPLGASWGPLGRPLGGFLGSFWGLLGASWARLGASWARPGLPWGLLGRLQGAPEPENTVKTTYFHVFCRVSGGARGPPKIWAPGFWRVI